MECTPDSSDCDISGVLHIDFWNPYIHWVADSIESGHWDVWQPEVVLGIVETVFARGKVYAAGDDEVVEFLEKAEMMVVPHMRVSMN